jgi:hypothetical protein
VFVIAPFIGRYEQNHDHYVLTEMRWGQSTLYQQGTLSDAFGKLDEQNYNFLTVQEGILVMRPCNLQLTYNRLVLGQTTTTSLVVTPVYLLNATDTFGARIVEQEGACDVYFSFSRQVRSGSDIFILFGDPNSAHTRGLLTMKVARPF